MEGLIKLNSELGKKVNDEVYRNEYTGDTSPLEKVLLNLLKIFVGL